MCNTVDWVCSVSSLTKHNAGINHVTQWTGFVVLVH